MTAHFLNVATDNIVAHLALAAPKVNSAGGKSIDINHVATKKPIMLRMPKLKCWGIDDKEFDGKRKVTLGIAFPLKSQPEADAVIANLRELDEFVKTQAIANSKDWFNKPKMSMEVVEALYTPILKYAKSKETGETNYDKPPSFNIKVPFWNDGRCDTEVYGHDGALAFPNGSVEIGDTVPKGSIISSLLQCNGIWFAGGKFGVTFKAKQVMVQLSDYLPRGVNLCVDAPLTRQASEAPRALTRQTTGAASEPERPIIEPLELFPALTVADSDDERDPEAEYAPDDAAPVKNRKRVVKKSA